MIKGRVVDIIDNRTLAINAGQEAGVKLDMIFQILKDDGKEIKDDQTGEVLGKVKLPKIKVKVVHVDEKFCVAETYQYKDVNKGGINTLSTVSSIFSPPKYVRQYETFEIDENQKQEIDKEKSMVKIGDLAEEIEEE